MAWYVTEISLHNLARILIRINLQWMEKISARTLCACHGLVGPILGIKTFKSEHAVSALDIKGWPFWGEHKRTHANLRTFGVMAQKPNRICCKICHIKKI